LNAAITTITVDGSTTATANAGTLGIAAAGLQLGADGSNTQLLDGSVSEWASGQLDFPAGS
jgi:hypothetical protein